MTKYSLETKLAAVHAYLEDLESFKVIAQKHGVSTTMLKKWVAKYREHGENAFQPRYTIYSVEFKMDVIKYIDEVGASFEEAARVFNIPDSGTVWNWNHMFETQGIDALKPKPKGRLSMKKEKKQPQLVEGSQEALLAEIEYLRMENAYLKKLNGLVQEERKSQSAKKQK
jgi:transposase